METTDRPAVARSNVADLQAEAVTLGIKVDPRWGPARLNREIEAAKAKKVESETPDPAGTVGTEGELVNVGSTADPVWERREVKP